MEVLERIRRVRGVWNWLPAFRAVAETQHIHHASRLLRVSPSALSRSIRLLEDQVGRALFERAGRNLRLNTGGEEFLAAVRDAMRRMEDGLAAAASSELAGPMLVMSGSALFDVYLLPALHQLRQLYPELIPEIHRFSPEETVHRILRGQLDVGLLQERVAHRRLIVEQVGSATNGIYCGASHPLCGFTALELDDIGEHRFAVIASAGTQTAQDGWSAERPRRIGMYLSDLDLACEVCESGQMLAILPDILVESRGWRGRLYRLPISAAADTRLYSVRRPSLSKTSNAEALIQALRHQVEERRATFYPGRMVDGQQAVGHDE